MGLIGTLHQFTFYGIVATIICLVTGRLDVAELLNSAHPATLNFLSIFKMYLFWSCAAFIPIAIIGAFETKYADFGEGLTFDSDNILVIMFAHIAEEILGLVISPFWLLKDIFTDDLSFIKILDYIVYFLTLIFIGIGIYLMPIVH